MSNRKPSAAQRAILFWLSEKDDHFLHERRTIGGHFHNTSYVNYYGGRRHPPPMQHRTFRTLVENNWIAVLAGPFKGGEVSQMEGGKMVPVSHEELYNWGISDLGRAAIQVGVPQIFE